jgi:hypothetical protein
MGAPRSTRQRQALKEQKWDQSKPMIVTTCGGKF